MFNLPVFVGLDSHTQNIQVCVMDQQRKILVNQSVANDVHAAFQVVAPFGTNVSAAIEASTGSANFAEELIAKYQWHVELAQVYWGRYSMQRVTGGFTSPALLRLTQSQKPEWNADG